MSYTSTEYQEMQEEEEKGKAHKIKRRDSDYDSETRYISRKGHREAYKKVAEEAEGYQPEPETKSKKHRTISVTQYSPESIKPKSLKVRTAKDSKERFERRRAEPEPEIVEDEASIQKVSKALRTRSQELRDIEDNSYQQQYAKEKGKRTARENTRAERKGALRAMPAFDRIVETAADTTQKVIDTREKLEEAKNKILHTQGRPRGKLSNKVPQAKKQPILTPAQKKRIEAQVAKAGKNISPKPRGVPFVVERKKLATTKHTLAVTSPSAGSITGKSQGNPFGGSKKGNPFGAPRGSMLGNTRRTGNPFEIKKRQWGL